MSKRTTQTSFAGEAFSKPKDWFGGRYLKKSNAKYKRPLESKMPLHVVLRSDVAKGVLSMRNPHHFGPVKAIIETAAKKYGIKIYEFANVGNHLHILIKIGSRRLWAKFIREITGRIPQVLQKLRGRAKGVRFWTQKPFTRIVRSWRKAYKIMKDYMTLNQMEAEGLISRDEEGKVVSGLFSQKTFERAKLKHRVAT